MYLYIMMCLLCLCSCLVCLYNCTFMFLRACVFVFTYVFTRLYVQSLK